MALALLAMVGVSAWGKIVFPAKTIAYRTSGAPASASAWASGYPIDKSSAKDFEVNGGETYIGVIEEFQIPNISTASEIKFSCHYSDNNYKADLLVYAFPYDMPAIGDSYTTDFGTHVNTAITGTALATLTSSATTATISGDALTTLKTNFSSLIAGDVLTLRVLLWTSSKAQISGPTQVVPSRRFHLEVGYSDITYPVKIGDTGYSDLASALSAAADNAEITLYDDCTITARLTFNSGNYNKNVTFKAAEGKNVVIYRWADFNYVSVLSDGKTIKFDGSATGASLTVDNQNVAKNQPMFQTEGSGSFEFKNVTLKNFTTGDAVLKCKTNTSGTYKLDNVTFENCSPTTALIVRDKDDTDKIVLSGGLTFTNCTVVNHISTAGRIKVLSPSTFSTTTINVTTTLAANNVVVLGKNSGDTGNESIDNIISKFNVTNADLGLLQNTNHTYELMAAQAYTLEVSDAGAATLVLPFASTIPSGATCYKLDYTSGADISATAESTTLGKDNAVLVIASKGKYKFVATTIAAAATGSGQTSAYGKMIGNYDSEYTVPANNYILTKHGDVVAFRKANGTTNKVNAYRAYMTASYSATAPEFLFINFDGGNETTAIDAVEKQMLKDDGAVYNLQGVRLTGSNLKKGIYVKNGKKFIVK